MDAAPHESGDGPLALSGPLDLRAAAPLRHALAARRGGALTIDASATERLGAQCLQILLAASNAWRSDGNAFSITDASASFEDGLRTMAAPPLSHNGA
jgi:chemotaxis protein CheX